MKLSERLARLFRRKRKAVVDGTWHYKVTNPDGSVAQEGSFPNMWPTAALNDILQVYFNASSQRTLWYMGLIDNAGFSALAASDVITSHGGWVENSNYGAATRPVVSFSGASGGQIATSSPIAFAITSSVVIRGAFLVSDNTKGGSSGILGPTGLLGSLETLSSGQALSLTYTGPLTAT